MFDDFYKVLEKTGNIHFPLPLDDSKSIEREYKDKKISEAQKVWDGKSLDNWSFVGEGENSVSDGILNLKTGARSDHWPETEMRSRNAKKGDYATFGSFEAKLNLKGINLIDCNRIHFRIKPDCPGLHSPVVRAAFINDGTIKIPDRYSREGFTCMNLVNHEWNDMYWEIGSIAHDNIIEVSFIIHRYGQEVSTGEFLNFQIKDIYFEKIEDPTVNYGWLCHKDSAVFPTTGYFTAGEKVAIANTEERRFNVISDDDGSVVFTSEIKESENRFGKFQIMDFSPVAKEGKYHLEFGGVVSSSFIISSNVAETSIWKLLNFIYSERCGCPVPNKHGMCHQDIIASYNDITMSAAGGWHDAADVSQETCQTGETIQSLIEAAEAVKDSNTPLYMRLMEEASWGLDYILRTRFGNGFRITGYSIRRWTDNFIGNFDDEKARVRNHSFINFQLSNIEALSASSFADLDYETSVKCRAAAEEDFWFAKEKFEKDGVELGQPDGHVKTASLSQYYSVAVLAACRLYSLTGNEEYKKIAIEYGSHILSSQEDGSSSLPMKGFFYRDETKRTIVHSSHQSRDYIFAEALAMLATTFPDSKEKAEWDRALRLHGDYLLGLMKFYAPYQMIPAGLHKDSELQDDDVFALMNRDVDFDKERQNYKEQLESGIAIGSGCYIRAFPVWFSFRGNTAVILANGKSASIIGNYFNDQALIQIAREQLYWVLGKNPFGQSLIYGEGSRFGQNYTALLGETVGELAVGVQTRANEDVPYWPAGCIATYREVWVTPATKFLMVAADVLKNDSRR